MTHTMVAGIHVPVIDDPRIAELESVVDRCKDELGIAWNMYRDGLDHRLELAGVINDLRCALARSEELCEGYRLRCHKAEYKPAFTYRGSNFWECIRLGVTIQRSPEAACWSVMVRDQYDRVSSSFMSERELIAFLNDRSERFIAAP